MFKFQHVSSQTVVDAAGVKTSVDLAGEELNVPLTIDEMLDLYGSGVDTTEVEITLGRTPQDKPNKVKVPQMIADYIVGRKLRSNQDQQAATKGDGSKVAQRAKVFAFLSKQADAPAFFARIMAATTPALLKAHNAWLDEQYVQHKVEIEKM